MSCAPHALCVVCARLIDCLVFFFCFFCAEHFEPQVAAARQPVACGRGGESLSGLRDKELDSERAEIRLYVAPSALRAPLLASQRYADSFAYFAIDRLTHVRHTRHTTHDTRHTTHDTRHTTHDTRHTTHGSWHTTHDAHARHTNGTHDAHNSGAVKWNSTKKSRDIAISNSMLTASHNGSSSVWYGTPTFLSGPSTS
jgi:hypothetical protein